MKTAAERVRERMRKDRVIVTVGLRLPQDVIESLKEIAPSLGLSSADAVMRAYISQGLRKDLELLEDSPLQALTDGLRRYGMRDQDIAAVVREAGLIVP
jgi:hypothetical protein